jgi:hypothetical protein
MTRVVIFPFSVSSLPKQKSDQSFFKVTHFDPSKFHEYQVVRAAEPINTFTPL